LKARNHFSHDQAAARIASQAPLGSKLIYADYVIDNSGSLTDLQQSTDRVVKKLRAKTGWTWRLSWLFPPYGLLRGLLLLFWRLFIKVRAENSRRRDF
jgi:dephospho-CoA kinase